ncbi:MAG: hypothetical protein ACRC6I_12490 [Paracoccaceae bacterium]
MTPPAGAVGEWMRAPFDLLSWRLNAEVDRHQSGVVAGATIALASSFPSERYRAHNAVRTAAWHLFELSRRPSRQAEVRSAVSSKALPLTLGSSALVARFFGRPLALGLLTCGSAAPAITTALPNRHFREEDVRYIRWFQRIAAPLHSLIEDGV